MDVDPDGSGIVEDAKVASKNYNSIYVAVLKQLGIPRRVPTPTETAFIDTWYNTYSFNKNIIIEACEVNFSLVKQIAKILVFFL